MSQEIYNKAEKTSISSQNLSESQNAVENIEETGQGVQELPEGVQFIAAPAAKASSISLARSISSRESRASLRLDRLSLPKSYVLQDTIQQFGKVLEKTSIKNMKDQINAQISLRNITSCVHLAQCHCAPLPTARSSHRARVNEEKAAGVMEKLKAKMKREAFDRLADKFFLKLPNLVLDGDISDLSQLSPESNQMVNTIFATMVAHAGKPESMHDHELYLHTCVGLMRFFETVIAGVQNKKSIPIAKPTGTVRRNSITQTVLWKLSEEIAAAQRSREILKTNLQ
ncbi:uncharacterized protein LOC128739452 [Sabethes cyaneus]|uniref:uncharacterized protein LOC128739452 n=1 Tax=Sabethes cyaneus TaxID=53552 RepID=UPI00237E8266|nr:uncharacterized protein LOC128739452 [Sabethes cyaneus]